MKQTTLEILKQWEYNNPLGCAFAVQMFKTDTGQKSPKNSYQVADIEFNSAEQAASVYDSFEDIKNVEEARFYLVLFGVSMNIRMFESRKVECSDGSIDVYNIPVKNIEQYELIYDIEKIVNKPILFNENILKFNLHTLPIKQAYLL